MLALTERFKPLVAKALSSAFSLMDARTGSTKEMIDGAKVSATRQRVRGRETE